MGPQPLYNLTTTFTPSGVSGGFGGGGGGGGSIVSATRAIGFRSFVLVTGDDSDPAALAGVDGSGNLTMRFRVNGANVWSRGADMVPLEAIEGRQSDVAYRAFVASVAAAHMNTLRINGIDLFFPDVFYDACDAAGILLYHDMQYSVASPYPQSSPLQFAEMVHSVRRLSHHPSVALYDGNNEMGSGGIWESFVMTTVAEEDPSRPPWPASPSNGWGSGVDRLTSLPNGKELHAGNFNMRQLEGHGPYQHGNGFPTVDDNHAGIDPMWPPGFDDPQQPNTTAATLPGFFACELVGSARAARAPDCARVCASAQFRHSSTEPLHQLTCLRPLTPPPAYILRRPYPPVWQPSSAAWRPAASRASAPRWRRSTGASMEARRRTTAPCPTDTGGTAQARRPACLAT
jgi:hypothetical protein